MTLAQASRLADALYVSIDRLADMTIGEALREAPDALAAAGADVAGDAWDPTLLGTTFTFDPEDSDSMDPEAFGILAQDVARFYSFDPFVAE